MVSPSLREKREIPRKAGGTGKKGKTFLENKSDLLSLVSGITDSKDAAVKAKVDKVKRTEYQPVAGNKDLQWDRGKGGTKGSSGGEAKKSSTGDVKRKEKEKALDEAKEAILAKRRAKKARKVERGTGDEAAAVAGAVTKTRKRVGFT